MPVGWTPHFAERFAGQPFKSVALSFTSSTGQHFQRRGEFVATATGWRAAWCTPCHICCAMRSRPTATPPFTSTCCLTTARSACWSRCATRAARVHLSSHLRRLGLDGIKAGVLYEHLGKDGMNDPVALAHAIKALPITVVATRPIDEAISTAGGDL